MNSELTVAIPVFNEEDGITKTLDELIPFAEKHHWDIVVINDGSTDKTAQRLQNYDRKCRIIHHPYNRGYGAALKTGVRSAQTPYVGFIDSDGQHRPEDLLDLWQHAKDFDMVVGNRTGGGKDITRIPGKWFLSKAANLMVGRKIPDLNSGLRIFRRGFIIQTLHLMPDGFSFTSTSTLAALKMGFTVGYFPITVSKRIGVSSVRQVQDGFNVLMLILRLIILFSPLRIFFPVAGVLMFLGVIYEVYILIAFRLMIANGALLFIISALIIAFFGLLVDQVSAMRRERFLDNALNGISCTPEGNKNR